MDVRLLTVYPGSVRNIVALVLDSRCDADDFLRECQHKNPKHFAQLLSRVHRVAHHQQLILNEAFFRKERDGIVAFDTASGWRLYAFQDGNQLIILTNGGTKNGKKEQTRDINKAVQMRATYEQAKKNKVKILTVNKL